MREMHFAVGSVQLRRENECDSGDISAIQEENYLKQRENSRFSRVPGLSGSLRGWDAALGSNFLYGSRRRLGDSWKMSQQSSPIAALLSLNGVTYSRTL